MADGVGGYEGGEVASKMAVEIALEAYRDSPREWGASKRLHRAVQRANIEVYNFASTVPELRRMATTLTAVAIENGDPQRRAYRRLPALPAARRQESRR